MGHADGRLWRGNHIPRIPVRAAWKTFRLWHMGPDCYYLADLDSVWSRPLYDPGMDRCGTCIDLRAVVRHDIFHYRKDLHADGCAYRFRPDSPGYHLLGP